MKIPFGPHSQNEGPDTQRDMLQRLDMSSVKFIVDADCRNDPEKMELYNLAMARGCTVVGRRWHDVDPDLDAHNIVLEARRYFNGWGETQSFTQLAQIFPFQVWEGPNEIAISDPVTMQKYAEFCNEFAYLIKTVTNRRAGIGGWAVGGPDLALWSSWLMALEATKAYDAVLTRHSYGPVLGDEGTWFALRHRRDQAAFSVLGYPNVPLLITECGTDTLNNASVFNKPWRLIWGWDDNAIEGYYTEWMKPFIEEISKDHYVLGAHLFTVGNGGGPWNNHDVAHTDIAGAMLRNPPVLSAPAPIAVTPPPSYVNPAPIGATHQVTATALNVRLFPWSQDVEPRIVKRIPQGAFVSVSEIVKGPGQTVGWFHIGPDQWVNGSYLKEVVKIVG